MIRFCDDVKVGKTKQTKEGYLIATARVCRTGTQLYRADEIGDVALNAGFKPGDVVRVYRHEDQVFDKESLASLTRVPVTIDHPKESVTVDNWADLAVGEVGDQYTTTPDGWVIVNPMVKDARAVTAAQTTHRQLSMGYTAEIVKARDGIDADFEMRNIRHNHLALCRAARAGSDARIGDGWGINFLDNKGDKVDYKTVVIGDSAIKVEVSDSAALERFKDETKAKLADAEKRIDEAIKVKDAEIGELKVNLKKAQDAANFDVDKLVADRMALVDSIRAVNPDIDIKGKTDADLRRETVAHVLGDEMVRDASDAEISGMFKAVAKSAEKGDPVRDTVMRGAHRISDSGGAASKAQAAWQKSVTDMNAWRNASN